MKKEANNTYAVILAGGVGSRFWPLSRELEPKQFLKLDGSDSFLQQTITRILPLVPQRNIIIVSNNQYKYQIQHQVEKFSLPLENIILEPEGKNTAPAIGLAAKFISRRNPQATMIVLPADHYIKNCKKLLNILNSAQRLAQKEYLVTIGIQPDVPHTGYGYIKLNSKLPVCRTGRKIKDCNGFKVKEFIEKPSLSKAKTFYTNKNYLWNSGIFIWKASLILNEISRFIPELHKKLQRLEMNIVPGIWKSIKPISVDYGVLEKSEKVVVIPADNLGWNDLGSWSALTGLKPKDKNGNFINGYSIDIGSVNTAVFGNNRLIATIGLKDLVVVDTEDALLISDKSRTEEVKKVVERIKQRKRQEYFSHKTVKRPWGSYTVISIGYGFKVKLVQVDPHKRLSLQTHSYRSEHWVVVAGKAKVTSGNKVYILNDNESTYIPKKGIHRLENPISKPLKIIEVQCGKYLEEDDIRRLEDAFRRS